MECPKCGYLMDDATSECPRCARMAQMPELPPAAAQPYYAAPGYAGMAARTSGLSIASLVCGIAGLCTCGVSALVGFVLGIIAMVQINKNPQQLKGLGLAISGMVVSLFMVGVVILLSIIGIKGMSTHVGKIGMAYTIQRQLDQQLLRFHTDTGVYPDTLLDLQAASERQLTTKVPKGSYHGPYVQAVGAFGIGMPITGTSIPANPLVDSKDPVIAHHWIYDKTTGTVHSPVYADELEALDANRHRYRSH